MSLQVTGALSGSKYRLGLGVCVCTCLHLGLENNVASKQAST